MRGERSRLTRHYCGVIDFLPVTEPKAQDLVHAWIPEPLRRSKQSPLTLIIRWAPSPEHGILKQLKIHFGRVRELVLNTPSEGTLREVFVSKFQNLEVLEISDDFPFARDLEHPQRFPRTCGVYRTTGPPFMLRRWEQQVFAGRHTHQASGYTRRLQIRMPRFLARSSKIPRLETIDLCGFIKEADEGFKAAKVHLLHLLSNAPEWPNFSHASSFLHTGD